VRGGVHEGCALKLSVCFLLHLCHALKGDEQADSISPQTPPRHARDLRRLGLQLVDLMGQADAPPQPREEGHVDGKRGEALCTHRARAHNGGGAGNRRKGGEE